MFPQLTSCRTLTFQGYKTLAYRIGKSGCVGVFFFLAQNLQLLVYPGQCRNPAHTHQIYRCAREGNRRIRWKLTWRTVTSCGGPIRQPVKHTHTQLEEIQKLNSLTSMFLKGNSKTLEETRKDRGRTCTKPPHRKGHYVHTGFWALYLVMVKILSRE